MTICGGYFFYLQLYRGLKSLKFPLISIDYGLQYPLGKYRPGVWRHGISLYKNYMYRRNWQLMPENKCQTSRLPPGENFHNCLCVNLFIFVDIK